MSSLFQPNGEASRLASKTIVTNVANTTGSIVVFTITGAIEVLRIWGVVSTTISANHTAAHLRLNDQTATIDISLNTGITLSGLAVGTVIMRTGLAAAALTLKDNAVGAFQDAQSAGNDVFTPFSVIKKNGATTTLDFRYTTSDNPSSGGIQWFMSWRPLSADANVS